MKKSGLVSVSLVFALSLLTACGGGMGGGAGNTLDQPDWEELVGAINELEVKVAEQEREIEALQGILTTVSEHLLAAEEDISDLIGDLDINVAALADRLTAAEGNIAAIQSNNALLLNPYLSVDTGPINSLSGPHVILTGANLHIRNGDGTTDTINGVGNLLVGYNEEPVGLDPGDRDGSHNLIVGTEHRYLSYGGFVAGFRNTVSGLYSSVSGGYLNGATTIYSSVSGGVANTASGERSSVSGGALNTASGESSSVSGGRWNMASDSNSSVSGGGGNTANGITSSVSGGIWNTASGLYSSVSGGESNTASGESSSVSGGYNHTMNDNYGWMACGGYSCSDTP